MKNKEPKDKAPESAVANTVQETELANRRSFMKNLAAGTVAAGALAGTVVSAGSTKAATISAQNLAPTPRRPTALLRVCFPTAPETGRCFQGHRTGAEADRLLNLRL